MFLWLNDAAVSSHKAISRRQIREVESPEMPKRGFAFALLAICLIGTIVAILFH